MLKAENITVRYGDHVVVDQLSFRVEEGQWLMLVGPNGAGKSTLIETIAQGVPYTGSIHLKGRDVRRFRPAQLAREIGVLSQKNMVGYAYTVEEVDVPQGFTATYRQRNYVFTVTNTSTLIQTGQLMWPIPVLAVGGMLLIAAGVLLLRKKRANNE